MTPTNLFLKCYRIWKNDLVLSLSLGQLCTKLHHPVVFEIAMKTNLNFGLIGERVLCVAKRATINNITSPLSPCVYIITVNIIWGPKILVSTKFENKTNVGPKFWGSIMLGVPKQHKVRALWESKHPLRMCNIFEYYSLTIAEIRC